MKTIFEGERIGIRPFLPADEEPLFLAARESIEHLCQWMVWCRPDYGREDSRSFIAKCQAEWGDGKWFSFVIYGKADGEFLGSIGLSGVDQVHGVANLGYWVRARRWRLGIAAAAVRLVSGFAFEELGLRRLELVVPIGNLASTGVAEKAGAAREGVLKGRVELNGKRHDAVIYSLLRKA